MKILIDALPDVARFEIFENINPTPPEPWLILILFWTFIYWKTWLWVIAYFLCLTDAAATVVFPRHTYAMTVITNDTKPGLFTIVRCGFPTCTCPCQLLHLLPLTKMLFYSSRLVSLYTIYFFLDQSPYDMTLKSSPICKSVCLAVWMHVLFCHNYF